MKKQLLVGILLVVLAVVFFGGRFYQRKVREQNFLKAIRQVELEEQHPASRSTPLSGGSSDRQAMFEVRRAYAQINIEGDFGDEQRKDLLALGRGLSSENEIVRATTDDFIRHLLTSFVRARPRPRWHQDSELDVFFGFYKRSSSESLKNFLKLYPGSPEAEYLKTI